LHRLNIPVYLDAGNHINLNYQPLWYGGVLTIFNLKHVLRTDLGGKKDLEQAKAAFLAAQKQVLTQGGGAVHIYYHPCEWVHQAFWDGVNFSNGANPPQDEWKLPPQKTARETAIAFETFEAYLKWMKKQKGVRFLTARDALTLYDDMALKHAFEEKELDEMAQAIGDTINFQMRGDLSLSPVEIFTLLNSRVTAHQTNQNSQQIYKLTSTIFGPAEPGPAQEQNHITTWSQLQRTAIDVADYLQKHKRIPSTIWLGSTGISPETYLATLASVLPALKQNAIPKAIQVRPAVLATTKHIAADTEQLWGWLFPVGWHAPALMQLARLQAWTIKPAMRQSR
jgi:hypothetical protein